GFSPEIIIRFGAVPVSKWLNVYLDQISPAVRLHIRESGVWADDSHHTTHFVQANETAVCQQLLSRLPVKENGEWVTAVTDTEVRTWAALETHLPKVLFAGAVVADVLELLPPESTLFMGNSSPIRYLDQYGRAQTKPIYAYASRGASGIDGNLSTALGIHTIRQKPFVAILGDITFYHDLNGLLALRNRNDELRNITIVLLYNNGGSIFNRLPIANIDPPFTELFLTPHGLDFELVVRMYGLDFVRVDGRDEFRHHLSHSLQDETPRVIEVRTDNQRDEDRRREINGLVR
ncbi:MAG: 2-succinyl-5-enolpyruvyl-6-hydroxy-3-cyclohexene-1-carboxylate synthase, partial [Chloroflexi bacterium]|nr:2-succinyl-5-enolpyruvyl-6-hydroxy-3-cyclohexene-1-carboxylate synthase [Chloroflexota bacterium]